VEIERESVRLKNERRIKINEKNSIKMALDHSFETRPGHRPGHVIG